MKYVYSFNEGSKDLKDILGGKGANLAEMTKLGLPVPRGFTVSTAACLDYYDKNKTLDNQIKEEILKELKALEERTGKQFGNPDNPLLVSVRSGARVSMPGMMDTILNLGLNDEVASTFATKVSSSRFVYDSYRRFIQMFSDVVMEFPIEEFTNLFDQYKEAKGCQNDTDLNSYDLQQIIVLYKNKYKELAGKDFPSDPIEQLMESVKAVFRSWNNDRAITYRKLNDIPDNWGTAVNVQEMVYGNKGETSGTGVAFTRNPSTGEKKLFGEYLINAQGEDVVAGVRTPAPIETLKEKMPDVYAEFVRVCNILEEHYCDMQDMEFTIEEGKLFMLQTRSGKRTAKAAIEIAVDLVNEGKITKEEALLRVEPNMLNQLLHPAFDKEALDKAVPIAKGLAASPGAATGEIYFSAEDATKAHEAGVKDVLLVREETSPEDIEGMNVANGILTVRGGMTSHAAVVARGMGTCCVCGCNEVVVNVMDKTLTTASGQVFRERDKMSFDGTTGNVYGESIKTVDATISGNFSVFMGWADEIRHLKVRANADNPRDAKTAHNFGAEGIGLCRTEHMFFDEKRIFEFRKMIVSETREQREEALSKILPFQREDFIGLFREMKDMAVVIRLLDPPLHEFLPKNDSEIIPLANALNMTVDSLKDKIESLKEFNPMMGHRGCRLSVTFPEITAMQAQAIMEAAVIVTKEGINVEPEIMIPLIGDEKEYIFVKKIVDQIAKEVLKMNNIDMKYKVGTMIEIPRACVKADSIARLADFFSFGTNDLTQLTYGFSRDDVSKFLKDYEKTKLLEHDPFQSIDQEGVGELVKLAVKLARDEKPDISLGVCGEHGGDPKSIEFFNKVGLDYVSCSPFRVPVARLAAARATIKERKNQNA